MSNIILCGLPLSGKSHFGIRSSKKLGWDFIETDQLIEESYEKNTGNSKTCRQIFQYEGEEFFRTLESEKIAELTGKKHCIISTGGGSLLQEKNIKVLKQIGKIIYLQVDLEVLLHRLSKKQQKPAYLDPKNPNESYTKLYHERIKTYEQIADLIINTNSLSEQQIINDICKAAEV